MAAWAPRRGVRPAVHGHADKLLVVVGQIAIGHHQPARRFRRGGILRHTELLPQIGQGGDVLLSRHLQLLRGGLAFHFRHHQVGGRGLVGLDLPPQGLQHPLVELHHRWATSSFSRR